MPELPEIEHLWRGLEPLVQGAIVTRVRLLRPDMARPPKDLNRRSPSKASPRHLLGGSTIETLVRHGKQLAIVSDQGTVICIHLGMSGQLRYLPQKTKLPDPRHVHCIWSLNGPHGSGRLVFRDPRRFGGIWCFHSIEDLRSQRWANLGPDAQGMSRTTLKKALAGTRRVIKAALLDQKVIAGVGNIYADESLFAARINPTAPTGSLTDLQIDRLHRHLRRILKRACEKGGSTIRSYVDVNGESGSFAARHLVYGRGGEPCHVCSCELLVSTVAQRTTVSCPTCQIQQ